MSRDEIVKDLRVNIKEAQARMKQVYDRHHREREFEEGDWVYLRLQPYRQSSLSLRKNVKLAPRFYGPFQVLKRVGVVAYKLALPKESRIHPVFHVSLLKKKIGEKIQVQAELPSQLSPHETFFPKPQAVLDRRVYRRREQVLIHWQGLSPAEATWEDLKSMKQQFPDYCLGDKAVF